MPHAGHFCCSNKCQFHLNTYVGGYVVSTVGEMAWNKVFMKVHAEVYDKRWFTENRHDIHFEQKFYDKFGQWEEIGCDRKYETMVFKAQKSEHKCCPYRIIVEDEVDFNGYNDAVTAYKGHLKLCNKWSEKV